MMQPPPLAASALIVALVLAGCGQTSPPPPAHAAPTVTSTPDADAPDDGDGYSLTDSDPAKQDANIDRSLAEGKVEARAWLRDASHLVGKDTRQEVARFVEAMYGAGAAGVYATEFEEFDRGQKHASRYVAVLPGDPAVRRRVIEAYNRFAAPEGPTSDNEAPVEDVGQKYLIMD